MDVDVIELDTKNGFKLEVTAKIDAQTGVEMEALTGVASIGLLTIYDMVKAIDKSMVISEICLLKKMAVKWEI